MMDTRNLNRDSLFQTALLRADPVSEGIKVKVRNLSNGGMMAEGMLTVSRGDRLLVELRNAEAVRGTVAWTQGTRIGIAFDEEIDARAVREFRAPSPAEAPRFVRPIGYNPTDPASLRKL